MAKRTAENMNMNHLCRLINLASARLEACGTQLASAMAAVEWSLKEDTSPDNRAHNAVLTRQIQHLSDLSRFCHIGAELLCEFTARESLTQTGQDRLLSVARLIAKEMQREVEHCTEWKEQLHARTTPPPTATLQD